MINCTRVVSRGFRGMIRGRIFLVLQFVVHLTQFCPQFLVSML